MVDFRLKTGKSSKDEAKNKRTRIISLMNFKEDDYLEGLDLEAKPLTKVGFKRYAK